MTELPESFGPVLAAAAPLAARFQAAGWRLYLVGGAVRDRLLGVPFAPGDDIDCTTDAPPAEIQRVVGPVAEAVWLQGVTFGTVGCVVAGRAFEITTHRAEQYRTGSRKPVVVFSPELRTDLSRRDFTVNAMAVSLPDEELHDPFGGRADLEARVLRTPIEPAVSFDDDPLRMLRAARFVAGLDLVPVGELESAVAERAERLRIVSAERVRDELDRLLRLARPASGVRFLRRTGVLAQVLPELAELPTGPFDRTVEALQPLAAELDGEDLVAGRLLVALCGRAPVGDAPGWEADLRAHIAAHARVLRWSRAQRSRLEHLAAAVPHVVLHAPAWADREVRARLAPGVPPLDVLTVVAAAAARAAGVADDGPAAFARAVTALLEREPAGADLPVDGRDVMAALGVPPGRLVGEALDELRRLQIDRGPLRRDEAIEHLGGWWSARSGGAAPA